MGVFWSGTDHAQINEMSEQGMVVATVFNKKGEMRTAYAQKTDGFFGSLFIDNIKTTIETSNKSKVAEWEEMARAKVKPIVYTTSVPAKKVEDFVSGYAETRRGSFGNHGMNDDADITDFILTLEEIKASKICIVPMKYILSTYKEFFAVYRRGPISVNEFNNFYSSEFDIVEEVEEVKWNY